VLVDEHFVTVLSTHRAGTIPSSQQDAPLGHGFVAEQSLSLVTQTDVAPLEKHVYPLGHSSLSEHSVFPLVYFGEQAVRRSRTQTRFDFIASTNLF
jgi:hypothetical protein